VVCAVGFGKDVDAEMGEVVDDDLFAACAWLM
jgi:hypothetical protein